MDDFCCMVRAQIEADCSIGPFARLRPGAHTEMQLAAAGARASVKGRLDRCYVAALEPLRYRGVLMFDQRVDVAETAGDGRE